MTRPPLAFATLTTQRLMVAILFILLFAMAVRAPVDTDTWWHLRSGEAILSGRSVPQTDPFSLTRGGQAWIDQSWLSQIVMVAFYRGFGGAGQPGDGGSVGLAVYTALLATAGMAFVFAILEGNVYLRAFVTVLSAATAAVFWSSRPQMMSFFLSTVILYLLYQYKRKHINRLWLIPPLMILWVNLHSGFAIGFIFLGGMIAGEILNRLLNPNDPDVVSWRGIRDLILITLVAAAALIINPYTIQMLTYPFRTAGIGALQQFIQEWTSPDFHHRETWPFLLMLFGIIAAVGRSKRGLDWTEIALVCGTAFMAFIWRRNIAVFAVVAAPPLAFHLNAILENAGLRIGRARTPKGPALILNWALLVIVILGALFKVYIAVNPRTVAQAQSEFLPIRAVGYLNQHTPPGPMFNTYNWGGYLMFAAPSYPVFVDGRTDLYDDAILSEWLNAMTGDTWQATFEHYGIRLVVIEQNAPLAKILRANSAWKETYHDDQASIFERQGAA